VKTRILTAVAVVLALTAAVALAQKKEDKDAILGTWNFASGENNGEPANDEIKTMKMTFTGDGVTLVVKDVPREGKYKLDPSKKPKEVTMTTTEGEKTTEHRGIYELEGDTLKMCFPTGANTDLPKEFSGKKDTKQMLLVLKRAK
jgi:uncharacterized protein (TIGR03067 family)